MAVNKNKKTSYAIVEQTEGIKAFWRKARKYHPLTQEEETSLFTELHSRGIKKQRRDEIIKYISMCNQRLLYSTATTFTTDPVKVLDYINEGNFGILIAIDKFDLSQGVRFYTFASDYVYRAMFEFNSKYGQMVRRSNDKKIGFRLRNIRDEFYTKNQRDPTNDELREIFKERFGIEIKEDVDMLEVNMTSIDLTASEEGDDPVSEVGEFAVSTASTNSYEDEIKREYTERMVNALLGKLSERDRAIVKLNYGIDCDYPMDPDDIAEKFGITRTRVNQILASSLTKMRQLTFNNIH